MTHRASWYRLDCSGQIRRTMYLDWPDAFRSAVLLAGTFDLPCELYVLDPATTAADAAAGRGKAKLVATIRPLEARPDALRWRVPTGN